MHSAFSFPFLLTVVCACLAIAQAPGATDASARLISAAMGASPVEKNLRRLTDEIGGRMSDEIVVLGAHLDSWDLETGALDNGCNSALVVDVARSIRASGLRPKRTIRFVLFAGEEQGMFIGPRLIGSAVDS